MEDCNQAPRSVAPDPQDLKHNSLLGFYAHFPVTAISTYFQNLLFIFLHLHMNAFVLPRLTSKDSISSREARVVLFLMFSFPVSSTDGKIVLGLPPFSMVFASVDTAKFCTQSLVDAAEIQFSDS